jgi:hypothetical protein
MTIETCMNLVDAMAPGGAREAVKLRLLGEIEGKVRVELHGESPDGDWDFDEETPRETILCVPHPYDQLYLLYIMAMLDYIGGDTARYENGAAMFNAVYQSYGKWLKRRGA